MVSALDPDDREDELPRARRVSEGDLNDRCVSVMLGVDTYGILIREVQEIIGSRPLTRVFRAPPSIAGVTSLRGEILPVIDLGVLLGTAHAAAVARPGGPRIVVVREPDGERRRAGLRVDALGPVRELPRGLEHLDPAPVTLSPRLRPFVRGLLPEAPICTVLDVRALFEAPDLVELAGGSRAGEGAGG